MTNAYGYPYTCGAGDSDDWILCEKKHISDRGGSCFNFKRQREQHTPTDSTTHNDLFSNVPHFVFYHIFFIIRSLYCPDISQRWYLEVTPRTKAHCNKLNSVQRPPPNSFHSTRDLNLVGVRMHSFSSLKVCQWNRLENW